VFDLTLETGLAVRKIFLRVRKGMISLEVFARLIDNNAGFYDLHA
jgi:hypothetical protein